MIRPCDARRCLSVFTLGLFTLAECTQIISIAKVQSVGNVNLGLSDMRQTDCVDVSPFNLTLNITTITVVEHHAFRLYQRVKQIEQREEIYVFLDMTVAESPAIEAALEATRDGVDSHKLLVLQDKENRPLNWCCHIGFHSSMPPHSNLDGNTASIYRPNCCDFSIAKDILTTPRGKTCPAEATFASIGIREWREVFVRRANVILEVTAGLQWNNFLVLYQTEFENQVRELINMAAHKAVRVMLSTVENKQLAQFVSNHFETTPDFHVVLITSVDKAQHILQLVKSLEPKIGKRISVTGLSKWLLFCQEGTVLPDTWMFSSIFDNIALISNPRQLGQGHHIQVWPGDLLVLTTLLYKTEQRELATVGSVNGNWTLNLQQDVFPNTKFGFNRRLFVVTTTPWTPYVYRHVGKGGAVTFSGFCIDLAEELSRSMNFTIQWTEPPDGYWGNDEGNGTWNGMVGQVVRQEVDMIVAPMGITEAREAVIDFTSPFFYDDSAVIFKKPDPNKSKWRTYIDIFRKEVLVCIATTLLAGFVIISLLVGGEKYIYGQRQVFANSYFGCFLYLYGAMLAQGGRNLPKSLAGRIFVSSWWLFCLVVAGTYSGNLIAVLTVTKDKPPFKTLKEMAAQDDYRFGTLGNSMWSELFKTSPRPEFQAIHRKMQNFYREDPDIYHSSTQLHLEKVKRGGYAYIADKGLFSSWLATNCDLILLKEKFFPGKYGIGLPNNSVFTKIFSDQVAKIYESGLLQVWVKKWWPQQTFCRGSLVTQARALSLVDMQSSFYVLAIGVTLSGVVLFMEALYHRLHGVRLDLTARNGVRSASKH